MDLLVEDAAQTDGIQAEAPLLRGWLASRLGCAIRPVEEAPELSVRLGGEQVVPPRTAPRSPSDLLSAELDQFTRDRIYEEAAAAAAA